MSDPQGLAFDPVAEDYDVGRAGWPAAMLDDLSMSSFAQLPDARRDELRAALRDVLPDVSCRLELRARTFVTERT